jgi:hypothetical protein
MSGKCKLEECAAPITPCHEGCDDYKTCKNWVEDPSEIKANKEKYSGKGRKDVTLNL